MAGKRGRVRYGYRRVYDSHTREFVGLEVVPEYSVVVRRIFSEHAKKKSLQEIATMLNQDNISSPWGKGWTKRTIKVIIDGEETYKGVMVHDGSEETLVPPILEP